MADLSDDPRPEIGLTGARFGGGSRRRRSRPDRSRPDRIRPDRDPGTTAQTDREADPDGSVVGLTGARFGGTSRGRRAPEVAVPTPPEPVAVAPVEVVPPVDDGPDLPLEPSPYTVVRPYVLTGGRTRAVVQFAVEALVTAPPGGSQPDEPEEHTRIRALCGRPRSVAEIAALSGMPLGVARVLLADMLATGVISVHRTADAGGPDLALMERVLSGLRRL